jgi:hypothetical protein
MDGVDRMIFEPLESDTDDFDTAVYTTEVRVSSDSNVVGKPLREVERIMDAADALIIAMVRRGFPSFSALSRTYPGGRRYRSWWPCSMPPEQFPDPRPGGFHFRRVLAHWPAHGPPGHRRCPAHAALGLAVVEMWRKFEHAFGESSFSVEPSVAASCIEVMSRWMGRFHGSVDRSNSRQQ